MPSPTWLGGVGKPGKSEGGHPAPTRCCVYHVLPCRKPQILNLKKAWMFLSWFSSGFLDPGCSHGGARVAPAALWMSHWGRKMFPGPRAALGG